MAAALRCPSPDAMPDRTASQAASSSESNSFQRGGVTGVRMENSNASGCCGTCKPQVCGVGCGGGIKHAVFKLVWLLRQLCNPYA
eukprot:204118-Chlamydomonas_euryale.AAC.1